MPSNAWKPTTAAPDLVSTNTDILEDLPARRAKQELIPMIARKSNNSINVAPHWFEVFFRQRVGRRCSCFLFDDDPNGNCPVCYATGIVGGYKKRGTAIDVLDVTAPSVFMSNVVIDYDAPTRPLMFKLRDSLKYGNAVYGELDWDVQLTTNTGQVDTFQVLKSEQPGCCINIYVKTGNETTYTLASTTEIEKRLFSNKLYFKAVFTRETPKSPIPKLMAVRLVYRTLPSSAIRIDVPLYTYSLVLEEYGIIANYSSLPFVADNTVKVLTTEDFFYDVEQGLTWKIIEVKRNDPLGILTSWDLTCRIVHPFEPYRNVPVGDVPAPNLDAFVLRTRETENEMNRLGSLVVKDTPAQGDRFPENAQVETPENTSNVTPGTTDPTTDAIRRR